MTAERSSRSLRPPLAAALSAELHQLERLTVRAWKVFCTLGVAAGALAALTVERRLGLWCAAASGAFLVWFAILGRWLAKEPLPPVARFAETLVTGASPWVFALVLVLAQGADYALASWLPPMLFCAVMVSHTVNLRPRAAVVVGVVGALAYPLLYWAVMRERLSDQATTLLIYQPRTQITRSLALLLSGGLCLLLAESQKRAFGRAEIAVREQDLFGKYRIVRHVASGAMGAVFEAVYCPEGGFQRKVAVKRIHPHLAEQKKFVDGFRREAELCSRLAHPNVIQVMDFGKVGDSYFLAMEYVDGMTLADLAERARADKRALPRGVVGYLAREILAGLIHAHEGARGADGSVLRIVHRDLCPQNVLVSVNGEVKISDFGVARALKDAALLQTLTVAGHASYVAPEQAQGERVDPRADLFPVGVMLWELLAGRRLFRRESEPATLVALLSAPVPPLAGERTDIDAAWDEWISRALAREPARRFETASAMAAALALLPGASDEEGNRALRNLVAELLDKPPPSTEEHDHSTEVLTPTDV